VSLTALAQLGEAVRGPARQSPAGFDERAPAPLSIAFMLGLTFKRSLSFRGIITLRLSIAFEPSNAART